MAVLINDNNSNRPSPPDYDRTVIAGTVGLFLFMAMLFLGLFLASSPQTQSAPQRATNVRLLADASNWL
jgi:hypothetical protein